MRIAYQNFHPPPFFFLTEKKNDTLFEPKTTSTARERGEAEERHSDVGDRFWRRANRLFEGNEVFVSGKRALPIKFFRFPFSVFRFPSSIGKRRMVRRPKFFFFFFEDGGWGGIWRTKKKKIFFSFFLSSVVVSARNAADAFPSFLFSLAVVEISHTFFFSGSATKKKRKTDPGKREGGMGREGRVGCTTTRERRKKKFSPPPFFIIVVVVVASPGCAGPSPSLCLPFPFPFFVFLSLARSSRCRDRFDPRHRRSFRRKKKRQKRGGGDMQEKEKERTKNFSSLSSFRYQIGSTGCADPSILFSSAVRSSVLFFTVIKKKREYRDLFFFDRRAFGYRSDEKKIKK
jgi:hypothetical protein